ncbi:hypothetical protein Q8F55_002694 [Vanrija albida]|uniref:Fungal-type protein kinase domain-containing protein n=1 Tax=Vanrija albida TaxID=181172 RepID=A0ABR3QAH5_9TREE
MEWRQLGKPRKNPSVAACVEDVRKEWVDLQTEVQVLAGAYEPVNAPTDSGDETTVGSPHWSQRPEPARKAISAIAVFLQGVVDRHQGEFDNFCRFVERIDGAQTPLGAVMYGPSVVAFLMFINNPSKRPIFDAIKANGDLSHLRHLLFADSPPAEEVEVESVYVLGPPGNFKDTEVDGGWPIDMPLYMGMSSDPSRRFTTDMASSVNRRVEDAGRNHTWHMYIAFIMREQRHVDTVVVLPLLVHCAEHLAFIWFRTTEAPLGGLNVNIVDTVTRHAIISRRNTRFLLAALDSALALEPRLRCPGKADAERWGRTLRAVFGDEYPRIAPDTASNLVHGHGEYAWHLETVHVPTLRAWAATTLYGDEEGRFNLQPVSRSHLHTGRQGCDGTMCPVLPNYPPTLMERWAAAVAKAAETLRA